MPPKIQIIGNEDIAAQYIPWAKAQWNKREGKWFSHTGDCLIEFFHSGDMGYIRFLPEAVYGFAFHPRTSEYPTGANTSKVDEDGNLEKLPTKVIVEDEEGNKYVKLIDTMFPLYDDDHGTMTLSVDDGDTEVDKRPPADNYGIISWSSENDVMSWRGWPAITLGCNRDVYIDGVTVVDVQTTYNTFYTPLSNNIYISGKSNKVPGNLKGAGISKYGMVAVVTRNYMEYDFAGFGEPLPNPVGEDWMYDNKATEIPPAEKAGKFGNYFDELYVYIGNDYPYLVANRIRKASDGWLRIGYRLSPINNMAVWFSSDGMSAEEEAGSWSWTFYSTKNPDTEKPQGTFGCSFVERVDGNAPHQYTVYGLDPFVVPGKTRTWRVESDTRWQCMYMLTKHGVVSYSRDDQTQHYQAITQDKTEKSVMYQKTRPDPTAQLIEWNYPVSMPDNKYTIVFSASQFKAAPFTWVGADVDSEITALASVSGEVKCVPIGTPADTRTVTATDNCWFKASTTYNVPVRYGQWYLTDSGSCDSITFINCWVSNTGWEHVQTDTVDMLYYVVYLVFHEGGTWECGSGNWGGQVIGSWSDGGSILAVGYERRELRCD